MVISTTPTATSPYPLFGPDFRLREGLKQPTLADHAMIVGNIARPVTA
jgi:hypothetical protein